LDDNGQIAGYFALAAGSMTQRNAPGRVRRNMPEPIPTVVLARLAVATSWQRQGIGSWLVADAVSRTVVAAEAIGIRAMIVNAANESVTVFYEKLGFARTVTELLTLVATLRDLAATLALPHPR
jgi:GNAT superfamily N-acetyltransferase